MSSCMQAAFLAIDVTTTELALAVRAADGIEDYLATPMRGGIRWQGDPEFPGFELGPVPAMLHELLGKLQARGWSFHKRTEERRFLSVACRQHDQVVLDRQGIPLLPAISWQCNAARDDVRELKSLGVEESVGIIEPRFVLPKLRCVLRRLGSLRDKIATVFMTGDWIAFQLTGRRSLSTSDALSNGLLDQGSRRRADSVLRAAGFETAWFPDPIQTGEVVGAVQAAQEASDPWRPIKEILAGWEFVSGLGDNHASAVGCGMKADYRTLVVSAGTSGTINLSCPATAKLPAFSKSLRFEFYKDSLLLLLMLGDCGAWYNRFVNSLARGTWHCLDDLNAMALSSNLSSLRRVLHNDMAHTEDYPPTWTEASLGEKAAWTQFSIVLELLLRVKQMLEEVRSAGVCEVESYVLTGGLSQSPFIQHVFRAGVQWLDPATAVKVSGRTGPLRYKTSAYGALINSELPLHGGSLERLQATGNRFPLVDCAQSDVVGQSHLRYLLRSYGL